MRGHFRVRRPLLLQPLRGPPCFANTNPTPHAPRTLWACPMASECGLSAAPTRWAGSTAATLPGSFLACYRSTNWRDCETSRIHQNTRRDFQNLRPRTRLADRRPGLRTMGQHMDGRPRRQPETRRRPDPKRRRDYLHTGAESMNAYTDENPPRYGTPTPANSNQ